MARLKVEDVPDGLMRTLRVEAAASGQTVRGFVLAWLERLMSGEDQQAPKEHQIPHARPSPKPAKPRLGLPTRKKQPEKRPQPHIDATAPTIQPDRPTRGKATVATVEPCRHGLLFHPGCNT